MKIEHLAIWTTNLEQLKDFYIKYFDVKSGAKYINLKRNFESYFLQFDSGTRLELMYLPSLNRVNGFNGPLVGYAHVAVSVGSKENVDNLTALIVSDGYSLRSGPRYTGDGYYESVILDPDGNQIEITI